MGKIRCGLLTPLKEGEKSVELKNYIPLNEDEEAYVDNDWVGLSDFFNKIDEVDKSFKEDIENAKINLLNTLKNAGISDDIDAVDFRELDSAVNNIMNSLRIDLKYEIGVRQEKEDQPTN